jgi:hypothetical protein
MLDIYILYKQSYDRYKEKCKEGFCMFEEYNRKIERTPAFISLFNEYKVGGHREDSSYLSYMLAGGAGKKRGAKKAASRVLLKGLLGIHA